jgi:hypothetical protein
VFTWTYLLPLHRSPSWGTALESKSSPSQPCQDGSRVSKRCKGTTTSNYNLTLEHRIHRASPSTSPEEATNVPQPVPDYPRPRSPRATTVESEAQEGDIPGGAGEEAGSKNQGNRQERRRQERKKDKYQTEEDRDNAVLQVFGHNPKLAHKEGKGSMGMDKARRASGTSGTRITQPVGKFMT